VHSSRTSGRTNPQNPLPTWPVTAYPQTWHFQGIRAAQFHAPTPMYPGYPQSSVSLVKNN